MFYRMIIFLIGYILMVVGISYMILFLGVFLTFDLTTEMLMILLMQKELYLILIGLLFIRYSIKKK